MPVQPDIFKTFFDNIPIAMAVIETDNSISFVNEAFCKCFGVSKADAANNSIWFKIIPKEELARLNEFGSNLVKDPKKAPQYYESVFRQNRTKRYFVIMVTYIADTNKAFASFKDVTENKKTEKKLRESNRKIDSIVNNLQGVVYQCKDNPDWTMTYLSDGILDLFGYPAEELIDDSVRSFNSIIKPSYRAYVRTKVQKALELRKHYTIEYPIRSADGKYKWILDRGKGIFKNDKIIGCEGFFSDINERKKLELELSKSEEKYRLLVENQSDMIVKMDLNYKFSFVSSQFCKMVGIPENKIIGKPYKLFVEEANLEKSENIIQSLLLPPYKLYREEKIKTGQGDCWIAWSCKSVFNKKGKLVEFIFVGRDVTEKKHSENLIRTLSKAIEQSPTSTVITNEKGIIEFVNQKFSSFLQYKLEEVKGRYPRIFNPGHASSSAFEDMWNTLKSGNVWTGEYYNRKKDGTRFLENVVIAPLLGEDGKVGNYIIIAEDITEKKKILNDLINAKNKAEESDHLKTAFLQNISHEIRTPMNAIVGFSELLNEPDLLPADRSSYTDIIIKSSNHLLAIISNIINIASIEAGNEKVNETEVELNPLVKLIYDQFRLEANQKEIILRYELSLPDDEDKIITDRTKLMEILSNLIGNAMKFTKQGSITFGYIVKGYNIEFYVKDTGIGISSKMHKKIFTRFTQIEDAMDKKYNGSGLGLSISKAYTELLGGGIWVNSELGKGSDFYFTIPYRKPIPRVQKTY